MVGFYLFNAKHALGIFATFAIKIAILNIYSIFISSYNGAIESETAL